MKSEHKVAVGNFGDSEASLKLKASLLETKLKSLTDGYQQLKQKNAELVCVYSYVCFCYVSKITYIPFRKISLC